MSAPDEPFLDITHNPSWTLARSLPSILPSSPNITIIVPPNETRASYSHLLTSIPSLIAQHKPDLVLHLGLAAERDYFAIERSAPREGYHQVPDVERKVFSKAKGKELWGKQPERLESGLDLDAVRERCEEMYRLAEKKGMGKGSKRAKGNRSGDGGGTGGRKDVELRVTDDVGEFVCGFVYYLSLVEMGRRYGGKGGRDVVFCHVPWLDAGEDEERGVKVIEALIGAMVEVWRELQGNLGAE